MPVNEAIRSYLKENGIKQCYVCQKMGIDKSKFSAMITGRRKIYAEDLFSICKVLDVSADKFNC